MKIENLLRFLLITALLIFSNYSLICQEILTVREVYDYDIGDEFHYNGAGGTIGSGEIFDRRLVVTNKSYSLNNDTVYYMLYRQNRSNHSGVNEWRYWQDSITLSYFNLDSMINNGKVDSTASIPDKYSGRTINYYDSIYYYDSLKLYRYKLTKEFVDGCGLAHRLTSNNYYYDSWRETLVYFKKGIEEWGEPITSNITGINDKRNLDIYIQVYPNPVNNSLTINSTNGDIRFHKVEIYSLNGILLNEIEMNGITNKTINIADLEGGVYVLRLFNYNKSVLLKKFIKVNY